MPLRPNMEPADFLNVLKRRKWLIFFSFFIILFIALIYCVIVPDLYESRSKIRIIPPTVAEGMVRSTVDLKTQDRLASIESDLFSRPRMLEVLHGVGVSRLGFEGMSESAMIDRIRSRAVIETEQKGGRKRGDVNTFMLSFLHEDPKVAQVVTSSLASIVIGENIKLRETMTQETTQFLDKQLEETRVRLEQQEEKLKRYKIQYGGELPQQESSNLGRLQRLSDQIKSNSESIARLEDRKTFLESQLSLFLQRRAATGYQTATSDVLIPTGLLSELAAARKNLDALERKYTPRHPAIVQARRELQQIEMKVAEANKAASGKGGAPTGGAAGTSPDLEPGEVQRFRTQLAQADLEIAALKRESASKAKMIEEIQSKVERLPQREQEIVMLTRDYDNIKKSYDELLDKKLKANISRNLEENQKAERFQVVEPAGLPTSPSEPDRLKVLMIALAVSLLVGIGGSFGLEAIDQTLRSSKEFRSYFELPVLAALPIIQNDEYKRREAFRATALKGGLIAIAGAYAIFLVFYGSRLIIIVQSIASSVGG